MTILIDFHGHRILHEQLTGELMLDDIASDAKPAGAREESAYNETRFKASRETVEHNQTDEEELQVDTQIKRRAGTLE